MKTVRTLSLLGALAAFAALAQGCGSCSEEKKAAPPAAPTAPSAASPSAAAPSPTGPQASDKPKWHPKSEEVFEEKKAAQRPAEITHDALPAGFPPDLPIFPDAKPKTSMLVGGSGLVMLNTDKPIADVVSHYREQLPAEGWTVDSVKESKDGSKVALKAHKEDRSTTLSISAGQGGGTDIAIALNLAR